MFFVNKNFLLLLNNPKSVQFSVIFNEFYDTGKIEAAGLTV